MWLIYIIIFVFVLSLFNNKSNSNSNQKYQKNKSSNNFSNHSSSNYRSNYSIEYESNNDKSKYSILESAAKKRQRIRISYTNNSGEKSQRDIDPLEYYTMGRRSYIRAYCHKRNEERVFAVSKISILKIY